MAIVRAILSVYRKDGLDGLARTLADQGVEILSTGGTATFLRAAGLSVTEIRDWTGSPEILGGRVKTLHPKVHAGILFRRNEASDREEMARQGFTPIDLVVVNLYPFRETLSRPGSSEEEIVEQIDIGGPTLLRAAAKNFSAVAVVTDPADYPAVAGAVREGRDLTRQEKRRLAAKACGHVASYDAAIAGWFSAGESFPGEVALSLEKLRDLRYGENPHQAGAFYRVRDWPSASFRPLSGKELSYNNYLDAALAVRAVSDFDSPAACVVKHGIPCGLAQADTLAEAATRAYEGDPVSAFGGILGLNRPVDLETAKKAVVRMEFLEVIVAPSIAREVVEELPSLARWGKNVRLVEASLPPPGGRSFRWLEGNLLCQEQDRWSEEDRQWQQVAGDPVSPEVLRDLELAWKVVRHVPSNAIVLAVENSVVGVGSGQPNRVDAVKIAIQRAGKRASGAVLASDAFFPFPDSIALAAEAGINAIVEPSGAKKESEVVAACRDKGISLLLCRRRHFRH